MDPHLVFSLRHLSAAALSAVAIYLVAHPPLIAWKVEGPVRSEPAEITPGELSARRLTADRPAAPHSPSLFFGYVEFDGDPNAPGGGPAFGP